jgi:hypothetical protein
MGDFCGHEGEAAFLQSIQVIPDADLEPALENVEGLVLFMMNV